MGHLQKHGAGGAEAAFGTDAMPAPCTWRPSALAETLDLPPETGMYGMEAASGDESDDDYEEANADHLRKYSAGRSEAASGADALPAPLPSHVSSVPRLSLGITAEP